MLSKSTCLSVFSVPPHAFEVKDDNATVQMDCSSVSLNNIGLCWLQVSQENVSGKHLADGATLFYMPHCDCHLYNNLLKANWGPHQLCKIAILGT